MLLGRVYIKDNKVILQDVDGSEASLTLEDALDLQAWLFRHNVELHALLHKPPEPMFNNTQALKHTQEKQEEREQML